MSLRDRGSKPIGRNILAERQGQWLSINYTTKKRIMVCRVVGGARAVDGQEEYLKDQILADVFGLESGVITEAWSSLVLYYDHINSTSFNQKHAATIYAIFLLLST